MALEPAAMANFNKMTTQVKYAYKKDIQRRREKKIEERRLDITRYNELWAEYNEIKKRIIKQREIDMESTVPNKKDKYTSKHSKKRYADFTWFGPTNNQFLDKNFTVNCQRSISNKNLKNKTSCLSLLESTDDNDDKNNQIHQEKFEKKNCNFAGKLFTQPQKLKNSESTEIEIDDDISATFDANNGGAIADLDHRIKNTERAFIDDDYGVFQKPIETTVTTHTRNFNAQHDSTLENTNNFTSISKFRNGARPKLLFSNYLSKNCLPSVCIENAETGLIRWRRFPNNDA
mmetsp:Transcript_27583/g.64751  ORF Transcript_27583/g.64751 Transcript_27583/m.64751 type:complete len:289 (+) Transcript_27583:880-1746(+)